ncbi:hypothetical protein QBC44DRAFT_371967 [Cladorrhinum sp. PSN332]|nr:hypothetical protein QBC44DRAFT_371967 [Cladorrhinum sp. PSN332]
MPDLFNRRITSTAVKNGVCRKAARDVEKWYRSYVGMLEAFDYHSPLSGIYWRTTMRYGVAGWLRAKDMEGMRANARDRYREHFETVRKMTRPPR